MKKGFQWMALLVVAMLIVDIVYKIIDPRIQLGKAGE